LEQGEDFSLPHPAYGETRSDKVLPVPDEWFNVYARDCGIIPPPKDFDIVGPFSDFKKQETVIEEQCSVCPPESPVRSTTAQTCEPCDPVPCTNTARRIVVQGDPGKYAKCTDVDGDLDLSNLSGAMACLARVRGYVFVTEVAYSNAAVSSLDGLKTLREVDGSLTVAYMPMLGSLAGLANLTRVGGSVELRELGQLRSLAGLGSLKVIGTDLTIADNPFLETLEGLGIEQVGRDVYVDSNPKLTSVAALGRLSTVNDLYLRNNAALAGLDGLSGLTAVRSVWLIDGAFTSLALPTLQKAESIVVTRCPNLTSLRGLFGLAACSNLYVTENAQLVSLGLDALTRPLTGTIFTLVSLDNPMLPASEICMLKSRLSTGDNRVSCTGCSCD